MLGTPDFVAGSVWAPCNFSKRIASSRGSSRGRVEELASPTTRSLNARNALTFHNLHFQLKLFCYFQYMAPDLPPTQPNGQGGKRGGEEGGEGYPTEILLGGPALRHKPSPFSILQLVKSLPLYNTSSLKRVPLLGGASPYSPLQGVNTLGPIVSQSQLLTPPVHKILDLPLHKMLLKPKAGILLVCSFFTVTLLLDSPQAVLHPAEDLDHDWTVMNCLLCGLFVSYFPCSSI